MSNLLSPLACEVTHTDGRSSSTLLPQAREKAMSGWMLEMDEWMRDGWFGWITSNKVSGPKMDTFISMTHFLLGYETYD